MTLCAVLMLGACSYPARSYNMIVYQRDVLATHPDTPFRHALAIARVNGGEKSYPLWRSKVDGENFRKALESSLGLSRLLADPPSAAKFDLYVNLAEVKQPLSVVFDSTVTSRIEYRVIEKGTNRIWFSDTVFGAYNTKWNPFCFVLYVPLLNFPESCSEMDVLRLANEGSIRKNIEQFIKKLLERKPPPI